MIYIVYTYENNAQTFTSLSLQRKLGFQQKKRFERDLYLESLES